MRRTEVERTVGVSGEGDGPDPTTLLPAQEAEMCSHTPICPTATATDHSAAHVVVARGMLAHGFLDRPLRLFLENAAHVRAEDWSLLWWVRADGRAR